MSERDTSEGVPEIILEEEIVPRGQKIYEKDVRPGLRPEDEGKFVVVDVLGGEYAIDAEEEEAFARVSKQADPEALFYFARIGKDLAQVPAHRIGAF